MRHAPLLLLLLSLVPACAESDKTASASDEVTARSEVRRARLARLSRVDALARLYVGHDLPRPELIALGGKDEEAVIAALTASPDFRARYGARIAEYASGNDQATKSVAADPTAPVADAFQGDAAETDRFARWTVQSLAPLAAERVVLRHGKSLAGMTYRELLDTVRRVSAEAKAGGTP